MRTPSTSSLRSLVACLAAWLGGCATQAQVLAPDPAPTAAAPRAPEPQAAPAPGSGPVAAAPRPLSAEPVYYALDSAQLTDEGQGRLRQIAEAMRARQEVKLTISGHTCELGTTEYNALLGARRAEQAKAYLVKLGVPEARLRTLSFGEERPAAPGHSEEELSKNRRSEFEFGGAGTP